MILALDIGNTHIVLGCMEGRRIRYLCRMATNRLTTGAEYAVTISRLLEFGHIAPDAFDGAIISSVVPQVTRSLSEAVKMLTGVEPMVVGPGIRSDLTVRLDDPATLASDLLVAAVGALDVYEPPLILIDMGTATTVTVLDGEGAFRGGAIIPGVQLSLSALASHTSLLPAISLDAPPHAIGTNTVDCMKSGSILGAALLLDGMIDRMEAELGQKTTVVATGGLARCIVPICTHEILLNEDLLLYGLPCCTKRTADKKEVPRLRTRDLFFCYSPSSLPQVSRPTMPSAARPAARWNRFTAPAVPPPKIPSTAPLSQP